MSDVLLLDGTADTGASNARHVAALYAGPMAGYEVIHGLVDRLMALLEVPRRPFAWEQAAGAGAGAGAVVAAGGGGGAVYGRGGLRYWVEPEAGVASYFPGRAARLVLERAAGGGDGSSGGGTTRVTAGTFGVLHPRVLAAFELGFPVSVLELDIEHFL